MKIVPYAPSPNSKALAVKSMNRLKRMIKKQMPQELIDRELMHYLRLTSVTGEVGKA
jgi:hypothetical protein